MKETKLWAILKNVIKVIITLAALYWVSTKISFSELKQALQNCNPLFLVLALILYLCSILVASSRLNSFFKAIGLEISERYNFRLYQLGLLYNFFLPGGIGGDGYKIFFLKKNFQVSRRKLLGAIFFDRLSGLWALTIISGALIIFMPRLAIPNSVTISVLAIGTISYLYLLRLFFKQFFGNFIITHFKALCVQGLQTSSAICILYAMNFDGKFSPYIFIFMVSSLVAIVPSIGGAIGLRETVIFSLATYLKLDEHLAVTISLIFYLISLVVASSGIYYIFRPKRLGTEKLPTAKEVEQEIEIQD
ncbi:lysylphosphatidylglycerol synthase transmembrane domain-containing protein [Sphingobacterium sp. HJSM2_6]|uniref:lysylphosphatidylglycerol synthase transmembrane domain-containing protein n=1 Tax=Sphingobacterium sp. HJSM2_6 TaxID=3366264 RepID=UPI003BBE19D6